MFNIDQKVLVKGVITGVSKDKKTGEIEYEVYIEDKLWDGRTVNVTKDQVMRLFSMDELEKLCEEQK